MNREKAGAIAEKLGYAKRDLIDALRIAERSGNAKLACRLGTLCGKTEVLQQKFSELCAPKQDCPKGPRGG